MQPNRLKQVLTAFLAVSASIGTAVITVATIATLTVTTLTATTAQVTTLNATSVSSTGVTVGQGTAVDKVLSTAFSINVDAIPASSGTSSSFTLTGASIGDVCVINPILGDFLSTTSTARVSCRFDSANTGTAFYVNAMPTSTFDAASSSFRVLNVSF